MIVKELFMVREDGVKLFKSYSDNKVIIRKVGTEEEYEEAIDVESTNNEYEETEKLIETREDR